MQEPSRGVQTFRRGQAGPVSDLLGGVILAGCFSLLAIWLFDTQLN